MTSHLTKLCRRCGHSQSLTEYYVHAEMADGHLNICKTCKRADARAHRQTPAGQAAERRKYLQDKAADKRRARGLIINDVARGKLQRPPCQVCGKPNAEAHHRDYTRPRDVQWLCPEHHGQAHRQMRNRV